MNGKRSEQDNNGLDFKANVMFNLTTCVKLRPLTSQHWSYLNFRAQIVF